MQISVNDWDESKPSHIEESSSLIDRLDGTARIAANTLNAEAVMISIARDNKLHSLGAFPNLGDDLSSRQHEMSDTVCQKTIESSAPLVVEDARTRASLKRLKYVREGLVTGYIGFPIILEELGPVGAICAISSKPRSWTELEQGHLQQVAGNVELTLLRELHRVEASTLAGEMNEVDSILSALTSKLTVLTSIYNQSGELVLATANLLQCVPEREVSSLMHGKAILSSRDNEESREVGQEERDWCVEIPHGESGSTKYRVACVVSASGHIVCSWFPSLRAIN